MRLLETDEFHLEWRNRGHRPEILTCVSGPSSFGVHVEPSAHPSAVQTWAATLQKGVVSLQAGTRGETENGIADRRVTPFFLVGLCKSCGWRSKTTVKSPVAGKLPSFGALKGLLFGKVSALCRDRQFFSPISGLRVY